MMTKPIHRIFLKRVVLTLLLAVMTAAAWADDPWVSGDCTVTLTDGTLTVSGNGAMADYGPTIGVPMSPWYYNANSITNIVIGSGVTHIGRSAFQDCDNLVTVTFEANSQLTTIGHNAFFDCEALPAIDIPCQRDVHQRQCLLQLLQPSDHHRGREFPADYYRYECLFIFLNG